MLACSQKTNAALHALHALLLCTLCCIARFAAETDNRIIQKHPLTILSAVSTF